jgi:serralysin
MTLRSESISADSDLSELKDIGIHNQGCSCGECAGGVTKMEGPTPPAAPPSAADLVPGDTSSTVTLTLGTARSGEIDTLGDHDWYRVTLVAGQTYTFTIDPTGATTDIEDSFLRLRSSTGAVVASNDDGGLGTLSSLTFTATASGTFFVDVGTYNDLEIGTFSVLAVNAGIAGADTIAGFTGTTGTIAIGGQVNSSINTAGDHDWYAVTLTAGQRYTFRTVNTGGGTDVDSVIFIRDAAGLKLANNDDGGGGTYSLVTFTAPTTGTYYIDVGGFANFDTGAYRLTAELAPALQAYNNDQIADQLINGYWGGAANAREYGVAPGGIITFNVQAISAAGQLLAREALNLWSDATGIIFSEVTSGGQITFADNQTGAFATSTRIGNTITSSNVNVGTAWLSTYGTGLNSYSFQTYIHEIGHAIGLGHGGNYNGNATYANDALYLNDAWTTTIMSYFDQNQNTYFSNQGFTRQFAVTPMSADIVATTTMYGTATTTRTGNTTYGFNNTSGRSVFDATQYPSVAYTIVDHGGSDTLDYSDFAQNQRINLNAEAFSDIGGRVGNVSIARGSIIENAIAGSGNDTIYGNTAANDLRGGIGSDILLGNDGNDTLRGEDGDDILAGGIGDDTLIGSTGSNQYIGGTGNDIYIVEAATTIQAVVNTLFEAAGEGADEVRVTSSVFSLDWFGSSELELLTATDNTNHDALIGNSFGNTLTGGTGRDELFGRAGNDTLVGGTGSANALYGQEGDDIYVVSAIGDSVVEFAGEGTDTVQAATTAFTLGANVENLTFTGGNTDRIGVGNNIANTIGGLGGADSLNGIDGDDFIIGADQFRFEGGESGIDRILDFISGTDRIALSSAGFSRTATIAFVSGVGAVANSGNSTFLYDPTTGMVSYDADGNGAGVAVQLAQLNPGQTVTSSDFIFY